MSAERAEQLVLKQVKFINLMLQEIRTRNTELQEALGQSYAKLIGLGTPYEEAIHSLRKVKVEFDTYLKILRNHMVEDSQHQPQYRQTKRR